MQDLKALEGKSLAELHEIAKALGIEWTTAQVKDLFEHGYNNIHFFTVSAVESVKQIAKTLF